MSKSPDELLNRLRAECRQEVSVVDPSVFGSAMQRCGQGRWWDALQEVKQLQAATCSWDPPGRNMYIIALARAVRNERSPGLSIERRQLLLPLAQQAWQEKTRPKESKNDLIMCISSTLRLCTVAQNPDAFDFAEDRFQLALQRRLVSDIMYGNWVVICETYGHHERVDSYLAKARSGEWKASFVVLGGLIDAAAESYNWRRAEILWKTLVHGHGIKPHIMAYTSRAKAYLMCGQPQEAVHVMDEMLKADIAMDAPAALYYCQCLLVIYHSSLKSKDRKGLLKAFECHRDIFDEDALWRTQVFQMFRSIFKRIQYAPRQLRREVRLHDILFEWTTKEKSLMRKWENHEAGSRYLGAD